MASVINVRDVFLQSETRTNNVTLPSGINVDYSNVSNGPPSNATANYFTTSTSDPTGGQDGDAHFNSSTNVMWIKAAGVWSKTGTISASHITTGTLAAARIAAGSITASKLSVSTLSAITANLGTVTAGDITGTSNLDITGTAKFNGSFNGGGGICSIYANPDNNATYGIISHSASSSGAGILSYGVGGSAVGVSGQALTSGSYGVVGINNSGGVGVRCVGKFEVTSSTLVSNLNADMVDGKHASSLCSKIVCNAGTANVAGDGLTFSSTVAGTRTLGSGNGIVIESTSDKRLKKDIKPEKLGLDFVKKLKPVTYRMKDDPDILYHGLVAQSMEGLINLEDNDCLYRVNSKGFYGVDYSALIAPVIKAIQEIDKKIELLNKKLKEIN